MFLRSARHMAIPGISTNDRERFVVRVKVLAATRDQLVVTHSGETRDFLPVRAGEWFARVAASRRRLADQPDLMRLDFLPFHDAAKSR